MASGGDPDAAALKLNKAAEFLLMAEYALDGECFDAATSLAVSSAINSGDALCLAHLGVLPTGVDHSGTTRLLRRAGFNQASALHGRALSLKNKAQYSLSRCTHSDAKVTVERAQRMFSSVKESMEIGRKK